MLSTSRHPKKSRRRKLSLPEAPAPSARAIEQVPATRARQVDPMYFRDSLLVELEQQRTVLQSRIDQLTETWKSVEASRARLKSLYDGCPVGLLTMDATGLIKEWNQPAAQLLAPGRRIGFFQMALALFVVRQDMEILRKHLNRCSRAANDDSAQAKVVCELRIKSGGHALPVQLVSIPSRGETGRIFPTAIIDLAEQKKNQRAVAEARELSDTIIETIREPLLVLNADYRILRVNRAFVQLFKKSPESIQGMAIEIVLGLWWAGNELRAGFDAALHRDVPMVEFQLEASVPGLGLRFLSFNARRLHGKECSPFQLLVAIEDITERKKAREQLAQSHAELKRLNDELEKRVEERTKQLQESNDQLEGFCYTIAHDLRAPLRTMEGFSSALAADYAAVLDEQGRDYTHRIIAAARRMDGLIGDLLQFGRLSTAHFNITHVDAKAVLRGVLEEMHEEIQKAGAKIELKGKLPFILGHPTVLHAAFANLLSNALKFVASGVKPEVTIWAEDMRWAVRFWISDNGIGIEPEFQAKIFEVFQRLHTLKEYPGSGIGLAIVKKSVQRLGGAIGLESEPGKGSRFWFELPRPGESGRVKP